MSCRWTALFFLFLPYLRVQSIDLTHARFVPSSLEYELPEVDGSAVDICRIFLDPTPSPVTTTTTPTTTTTTTTTTRKQVVTTTKKPAVQSPPNKTKTKNSGAPIRPKLPPSRPIYVSHYNPAASLLYSLWANNRGHTAASLQQLNSIISQSVRKLPRTNYGVRSSDSDESGATVLKRAGRMNRNRWKIGSFSSEDSSDES